jgi:integrase
MGKERRSRRMTKGKYPKGIYKRGKTFWLRYAGLDGKIVYESSGSDKLKFAEALLHRRKADMQVGKQPNFVKIKNHTFQELAEEYIKWAERQRAFKQKRLVVIQLASQFGHYPLRRFGTRMLEHFQTERLQKGNRPGTVNRHISIMKHMFTKAVDWEMVDDETLKRVRRVKLLEENNRRLRYLSKEECQSLIRCCDNHLKPIVTMALNTGMRKGEILNLKWDNVDLRHRFILLDHTKNGERREIPINDTLRETFTSLTRRIVVPYVFVSDKTGQRYSNLQRSFNTACRRTGIKDFHFHDLRHTFASQLIMAGVDLTTIKELLGHKTLAMTLRYAHLAPSHKVKAVDILDNAINRMSNIQELYKKEGLQA